MLKAAAVRLNSRHLYSCKHTYNGHRLLYVIISVKPTAGNNFRDKEETAHRPGLLLTEKKNHTDIISHANTVILQAIKLAQN